MRTTEGAFACCGFFALKQDEVEAADVENGDAAGDEGDAPPAAVAKSASVESAERASQVEALAAAHHSTATVDLADPVATDAETNRTYFKQAIVHTSSSLESGAKAKKAGRKDIQVAVGDFVTVPRVYVAPLLTSSLSAKLYTNETDSKYDVTLPVNAEKDNGEIVPIQWPAVLQVLAMWSEPSTATGEAPTKKFHARCVA